MLFNGQNLLKPLWNKLKPTKAVKNKKNLLTNIGLASTPNDKDNITINPATILTIRPAVINFS
jgi:hypothetical protein